MLEVESFIRALEDLRDLKNKKIKTKAETEEANEKENRMDLNDKKRWIAFLRKIK